MDNNKQTQNDEPRFLREKFLNNILDHIEHAPDTDQSYVLAIDGVFGSGKSFFLDKLEKSFTDTEFQALSINAWEQELHQNPLLSILSILFDFSKSNKGTSVDKKMLIKGAKAAVAVTMNIASGYLKTKTGFDLKDAVSTAVNAYKDDDSDDAKVAEFLSSFNNQKLCVQDIKSAFVNFSKPKKLIIIVDELDRCSPKFAIRFLETLHHFFKIPSIIFVLGINKKQIEISVKKIYGYETDTEEYLRKFIDRTCTLEVIGKNELEIYIKDEVRRINSYILNDNELKSYVEFISTLIIQSKVVFRQINQLLSDYLDFIRRDDADDKGKKLPYSIAVFYLAPAIYLYIKMMNDDLAKAILDDSFKSIEVLEFLYKKELFNETTLNIYGHTLLFALLDSILNKPCEPSEVSEIENVMKESGFSSEKGNEVVGEIESRNEKLKKYEPWKANEKRYMFLIAQSIERAESLAQSRN